MELLFDDRGRERLTLMLLFDFQNDEDGNDCDKQNENDGDAAKDKKALFILIFTLKFASLLRFLLYTLLLGGVTVFDDNYLFFFLLGQRRSCFLARL